MKIFFEDYIYPASKVEPYIDKAYLSYLKNDRVSIPCVGYYFSSKPDDTVFILPKVFINVIKTEDGVKELAFGKYAPQDIIDISDEKNPLVKSEYFSQVFNLSTWIYRAIAHFNERNPENTIVYQEEMRNVENFKGKDSETYIDIILRLIRFNNEHKALFTYIARINNQGYNKINWHKTIARHLPFLQDGDPVYLSFCNKVKAFNFDEELLLLFYSVLDYLHDTFNFRIRHDLNYKTDPRSVGKLITSGKGTRLLKSIRKKYFKDELVELWNILYIFFQKAQFVATKGVHREFLLARDFNIVFEDMIDSIISDDTKMQNEKLKDQPDGKIVDHIYKYESLTRPDYIYYIGDSKYYKEGSDPGENSIFKQFTYVRNVIQMNMDLWDRPKDKKDITRWSYFDEKTEGYNITPNFFIRGEVHPDHMDYNDPQLTAEKDSHNMVKVERTVHHHNRIFDRDTLFVQKYSINFLYVLSAYAQNHTDDDYKKSIREKYRKNLLHWLAENYIFLLLTPKNRKEDPLEKHFHELLGKVFSYGDKYLMGLDLGKTESEVEAQKSNEEIGNLYFSLRGDFKMETFDIVHSVVTGEYHGRKLEKIVDDDNLARNINAKLVFNPKLTTEDIVRSIEDEYRDKYFGMETNDWRHIVNDYLIVRPMNEEDVVRKAAEEMSNGLISVNDDNSTIE